LDVSSAIWRSPRKGVLGKECASCFRVSRLFSTHNPTHKNPVHPCRNVCQPTPDIELRKSRLDLLFENGSKVRRLSPFAATGRENEIPWRNATANRTVAPIAIVRKMYYG